MRFLPVLFALALAGCGSTPEDKPRDEAHSGAFANVMTRFWTNTATGGSAFVSSRTCADGAVVTREHLLACDPTDSEHPPFWADLSIETLPEGKTSRALVLAGLGHEPAAAPRRLSLERSSTGRWKRIRSDGTAEDLDALDGCDDVEIDGDHVSIGVAIQRLALKPGESKDFERAVIRLPGLAVERVKRRLTRVDETTWGWEGLGADGAPAWRVEVTTDAAGAPTALSASGLQERVVRSRTIR